MKLKILIFDQQCGLRELLKTFLSHQGHEILAFQDPTVCPLYRKLLDEQCCCPKESPCADVILADIDMPNINALDFLKLQRRRGCKALDANKAVMSVRMTSALAAAIAEFGCHHIVKPFRLGEIKQWVEECRARLVARQQDAAP